MLLRQPFPPDAFDQVILGCVNVIADEMNPARVAALRLGMGEAMTAFTVQINCGSGMQSIDTAYRYIQEGISDLTLGRRRVVEPCTAGVSITAPSVGTRRSFAARDFTARLKAFAGVRPSFFKPVIGLERGLTDPIVELNMGQTAEILAHEFGISRHDADEYAAESQQRLVHAHQEKYFEGELEPAFGRYGRLLYVDDGERPDSTAKSVPRNAWPSSGRGAK